MTRTLGAILTLALFVVGCRNAQDPTSIESKPYPEAVEKALTRNTCLSCHRVDTKLVGPGYTEIAQRHSNTEEIISLIKHPDPSRWPNYPPMVGYPVSDEDGRLIANWILSLRDSSASE